MTAKEILDTLAHDPHSKCKDYSTEGDEYVCGPTCPVAPPKCRDCGHPATNHTKSGCMHREPDYTDTENFTAPVLIPGRLCVCDIRGPGE